MEVPVADRSTRKRLFKFLLAIALVIAAPPPLSAKSPDGKVWVGQFSSTGPGVPPEPWRVWDLKAPRQTEYRIAQVEGRTVLEAESLNSASALIRRVAIDPRRHPYLNWTWKTEGPVSNSPRGARENDDFPARIFVLFEQDRGFLSSMGNVVNKIAGGFSGLALNYVWAAEDFAGRSGRSPVSDRVEMIGVAGGQAVWRAQQRNVAEDFERAFGEPPGMIVAVAIMTDTDNTGGQATSYYGDIYFSDEKAHSLPHPGRD